MLKRAERVDGRDKVLVAKRGIKTVRSKNKHSHVLVKKGER